MVQNEPLGFWDRFLDWLCHHLALCVEALSEEKKDDGGEIKNRTDLL